MVNIIRFGSKLCGEELLNIEVVLGICVRTKPDDVYHVYEVDASEVPTTA